MRIKECSNSTSTSPFKSHQEIHDFLSNSSFGLFNKIGSLQLKDVKEPAAVPVKYHFQFHSEINLKKDMFISSKNFLVPHTEDTHDSRYNPFAPTGNFKFVNLI